MGAEAGKTPKGGHGAPQSQDKQPQCQPGHGNDTRACTLCETTNFLSRSGTRMTWFTSTAIRSMRLFMQRNERLHAATCRQCLVSRYRISTFDWTCPGNRAVQLF